MGGVKRRTPQEMINIKDRTGYQLTDSDISFCGKGQKFVPMRMRVDLIKKHEDFIKFSRKLRLQVYFDNCTNKDSQGSNLSSGDLREEEGFIVHKGPSAWERQSEFVPKVGENGALDEFLIQVYWDLFNPKNRKWVKDNLTGGERDSLEKKFAAGTKSMITPG